MGHSTGICVLLSHPFCSPAVRAGKLFFIQTTGLRLYNMAMVDEFLDLLTEDYTALYNDNAILKNKLKVLSETVEEYRATDTAMRKTLLAAQQMAEAMVSDAEKKKNELVHDAEAAAQTRLNELKQHCPTLQRPYKTSMATSLPSKYSASRKPLKTVLPMPNPPRSTPLRPGNSPSTLAKNASRPSSLRFVTATTPQSLPWLSSLCLIKRPNSPRKSSSEVASSSSCCPSPSKSLLEEA